MQQKFGLINIHEGVINYQNQFETVLLQPSGVLACKHGVIVIGIVKITVHSVIVL